MRGVSIYEDVTFARGSVICNAIILETAINIFLTDYISKPVVFLEVYESLFSTDKIMIGNKRELLLNILKRKGGNKSDYKSLNKEIEYLIKQRNIFAHQEFAQDDEANKDFKENGALTFIKYKGLKERNRYSPDEFFAILSRFLQCATKIQTIKI